MHTIDSVVDNPDLYVVRSELRQSIEDGQKALAIVDQAIAEMEGANETRINSAPA
jgi:hypothetical protein